MPYPRWLAQVNKRLFNPRSIRKGRYPVVTHVGRTSGRTYRTPLDAYPTKTGYVLVSRYGPESDWVQNILASGHATLHMNGEELSLGSPRLVSSGMAVEQLTAEDPPADFTKAEDFILMVSQTQEEVTPRQPERSGRSSKMRSPNLAGQLSSKPGSSCAHGSSTHLL